jgi:hypothetical protein
MQAIELVVTSFCTSFFKAGLRPGDDTMELEPQGDDEIGRTSL